MLPGEGGFGRAHGALNSKPKTLHDNHGFSGSMKWLRRRETNVLDITSERMARWKQSSEQSTLYRVLQGGEFMGVGRGGV